MNPSFLTAMGLKKLPLPLILTVCGALLLFPVVFAAFRAGKPEPFSWDISFGYGPRLTVAEYTEARFPGFLETLEGGDGTASVAFETQGEPLSSLYKGGVFRPVFTATVVIAAKGAVAGGISGWQSLLAGDYMVSLDAPHSPDFEYLVMAIASGLDQEPYGYTKAIALLRELKRQGRLSQTNNAPRLVSLQAAPVMISFDYKAQQRRLAGENLAIIVPEEGTLSFKVGLFSGNGTLSTVDREQLAALGYRLSDTPEGIGDIQKFNNALPGIPGAFRRTVLGEGLFTTATEQEHLLSYYLFIMVLVFWSCSLYYRIADPGIKRQLITISVLLIFWILFRMVRVVTFGVALSRYAWYAFYIPIIFIPLLLFRIGLISGGLLAKKRWKRIYRFSFALSAVLLLLVLTNDLHQWAFYFPKGFPYYEKYGYHLVYYIIALRSYYLIIAFTIITVFSNWKKIRIPLLPMVLLFVLFLAYGTGYVLDIPFVNESEMSVTYSLFTLSFIEIAMRSRLIQNNVKYGQLFLSAPCCVQIFSDFELAKGGIKTPEYKTAAAGMLPDAFFEKWNRNHESSIVLGDDETTRYDIYSITGGLAVAGINLDKIISLTNTLKEYNKRLEKQNAGLLAVEKIKRETAEVQNKQTLYAAIDGILHEKIAVLQKLLNTAESQDGLKPNSARIKLMANYCKRRSSFAILEAAEEPFQIGDLGIFLEEALNEADINGIVRLSEQFFMSTGTAVLIYDFFEETLEQLLETSFLKASFLKEEPGGISVVVYIELHKASQIQQIEFRMMIESNDREEEINRMFPLETKEESRV